MVKTKTYSFWTYNYHKVTGVIKVCIIVSFVTESSYGAYQRTRSYFFKFLWNAGPDRITRKLASKNLSSGGLRMPHIYSFIKALKISWLRRAIQQANNTTQMILIKFYHLEENMPGI